MTNKLDGIYSIPNCICINCKNFIGKINGKYICKAYKQGIPIDIWTQKINHFEPVLGDNGIVYEENDELLIEE